MQEWADYLDTLRADALRVLKSKRDTGPRSATTRP